MKSRQQHLGYSSTTKLSEGKGRSGAQAPTLDRSERVLKQEGLLQPDGLVGDSQPSAVAAGAALQTEWFALWGSHLKVLHV